MRGRHFVFSIGPSDQGHFREFQEPSSRVGIYRFVFGGVWKKGGASTPGEVELFYENYVKNVYASKDVIRVYLRFSTKELHARVTN